MDLYAENILDHYRHPRNVGTLDRPTAHRHEENASCGDDLTIALRLEDGVIVDVRWQGTGCAISQASMSMLSEALIGMSAEEASDLPATFVYSLLGVPIGPRRVKCALLGLHAMTNALRLYAGTPPQQWTHTAAASETRSLL